MGCDAGKEKQGGIWWPWLMESLLAAVGGGGKLCPQYFREDPVSAELL